MRRVTQLSVLAVLFGVSAALSADDDLLARGEAIATQSGCAGCHTPPGGAAYSGFNIGGWVAYNITSDPVAGIGDWSDDELVTYLRTGHVNGKAQAGGPMASIVESLTSPLSDGDMKALVAYLRAIPPANPDGVVRSRASYGQPADDVDRLRGEAFSGAEGAGGARLYMGNCAACHGSRGEGGPDGYYPSLVNNSALGAATPDNLINVILHGQARTVQGREYYMPGFAAALSDDEIASLGSYLLQRFGRPDVSVSSDDVKSRR